MKKIIIILILLFLGIGTFVFAQLFAQPFGWNINPLPVFYLDGTDQKPRDDWNFDLLAGDITTTGTLTADSASLGNLLVDSNVVNLSDTTDEYVLAFDVTTQTWRGVADQTGAGGSAITFDIGDDGGDDSTDLVEIATTGDTNSIFTLSDTDKMLINMGQNWPIADSAVLTDSLSANPANCAAGSAPLGINDSGVVEGCFDVWTEAENTSAAYISATLTEEEVEDFVGTMLGGTETHIAVTYQDATNDIDFVVSDDWWNALTDMALTDTYIYVGNASNNPVGVAMSNDCTIASNGAITCDHDALANFVENEHLDWTGDLGEVNIHAGNYTDTDTTYTGGTNLSLVGTTFNVDDAFMLDDGDMVTGNYNITGILEADTLTDGTMTIHAGLISNATGLISQWTNDSVYLTTVAYGDLTGNPSDVITAGTGLAWDTDTINWSATAFDLTSFPADPNADKLLMWDDDPGELVWATAGAGDVEAVGDCASGLCLDGSSDGGTNITFYNIDSNKTQLIASDIASDLVITLPVASMTIKDWEINSGTIHTDNYIENVSTTLSVGTVGVNTVAITSDGGADDVTLPAATVSAAGMLTTAKWGEIVANNAKVTNATHTGDVTGATALTIGNDKVLEVHLKAVDEAADEECLTFEATTGDFEWQSCGGTPTVITVADTADTTSYVALFESATGDLGPKTDLGITYNAGTGMLTVTGITSALTGNASTATALAANGANCGAGEYALGVDASGAVESCTDATTEINTVVNALGGTGLTCAAQSCNVDLGTSIDISAETNLTAGRSLTLTGDDVLADAELYTDTKCIYWEDNLATDDFQSVWYAEKAVTITRLWCESDQTVNMTIQEDDGSPADIETTDLVCDSTPADQTSGFEDAAIAAGSRIDLAVESVSGTPTWCSFCWSFTYDD